MRVDPRFFECIEICSMLWGLKNPRLRKIRKQHQPDACQSSAMRFRLALARLLLLLIASGAGGFAGPRLGRGARVAKRALAEIAS